LRVADHGHHHHHHRHQLLLLLLLLLLMLGLALLVRLRSVGNSARICDPVSRRLQTDSLQSTVCLCLPV